MSMGWITRKLRLCIPLGRQERSAPNEGTQLLELDESLGVQRSGLSEETISRSLETRTVHIESAASIDQNEEAEICTICQAEYESGEKVATLNCDHEYHVDCIKPWLRGKNACPICKRPAANTQPQMPSCAMIDHVPSSVA
ncbi:hypothetical protein C5167_034847 [Papaver somniferum]|uniref:RING-type E3 ubiquitin transferase n=1 Tax=Papaver somniferum TaxID=3469 RepID=A0A4Y7KH39_PAPSO|nr:hypothetical protein C5167_034847 [Papaver somniferum]